MRAKTVGSRAALRRRCRWRVEVGRCQIAGRAAADAAGRAAVDAAAAIDAAGRAAAVVVVGHCRGERERRQKKS